MSYIEAVDKVCLECHYLNEETCSKCPVRKTVQEMEEEEVFNVSSSDLKEWQDSSCGLV